MSSSNLMRKRRSLGSFRLGRDEVDIVDVPLSPSENGRRRSLRSFSGSMKSIFGREAEDIDPNFLSDFQQQSLSVFESEHMWAHFKAHLADNKIQTSAGVRAMLPEFVNDRVLDGSVRSDRPVYPASNHSMDVSERCHSVDYSQTLRGDAGHVLSLHELVNAGAQNNGDTKGLGKVIPACLSIDNSRTRRRRSSVFLSLGCNDEPSDDDDYTASLSLDLSSRLSLDLSSRRASLQSSFLASLGMKKEVPLDVENKLSSEEAKRKSWSGSSGRPKFVMPVEPAEQNDSDIVENTLVQDSNHNVEEGDIDSKPFSDRSCRSLSACERQRPSMSPRASIDTDTLLVEWGESDELSSIEDEVDGNHLGKVVDIERTDVTSTSRNGLFVDWNETEKDDGDSDLEEADTLDRGILCSRPSIAVNSRSTDEWT